jgi:hypothetical protein
MPEQYGKTRQDLLNHAHDVSLFLDAVRLYGVAILEDFA